MTKLPMRPFPAGNGNKSRAFKVGNQLANLSRHTQKTATKSASLPAPIPTGKVIFVTGTDTGVGKTVFAALLTRQLRKQCTRVAALKPVCSGGRQDGRALRKTAGNVLSLDEVNPWHFRAPLAPLLAARRERKKARLAQVVRHVHSIARRFEVVVVEGAGGLLSPLGADFDSRDLIVALKAEPIVVASNRLGVVNEVLLTLEALPRKFARRAQIVLVNPPRHDLASRTNPDLLRELVGVERVHVLPWLNR